MKFINAGYNNMVSADKVVALVSFDSAPSKRLVQDSKDKGCAMIVTEHNPTILLPLTDRSLRIERGHLTV